MDGDAVVDVHGFHIEPRAPWRKPSHALDSEIVAALAALSDDFRQVVELVDIDGHTYLDDELDESRAARIAEHLEDCRRCGLELEAYEQIKSSLARRRPEVPAESVERLRAFGRRLAQGEEPSST